LQALAKEPTPKLLASGYIREHGLGSVGEVQHSPRKLEELDLIEKEEGSPVWHLVDPILAIWEDADGREATSGMKAEGLRGAMNRDRVFAFHLQMTILWLSLYKRKMG
jgi:hypothetical protein